jgi:hypothetical protein
MIKNVLAGFAVVICCIGAAEVPGTKPAKAYGRTQCWYETAYYVQMNCYAVAKNQYGQIIQVCCD